MMSKVQPKTALPTECTLVSVYPASQALSATRLDRMPHPVCHFHEGWTRDSLSTRESEHLPKSHNPEREELKTKGDLNSAH